MVVVLCTAPNQFANPEAIDAAWQTSQLFGLNVCPAATVPLETVACE